MEVIKALPFIFFICSKEEEKILLFIFFISSKKEILRFIRAEARELYVLPSIRSVFWKRLEKSEEKLLKTQPVISLTFTKVAIGKDQLFFSIIFGVGEGVEKISISTACLSVGKLSAFLGNSKSVAGVFNSVGAVITAKLVDAPKTKNILSIKVMSIKFYTKYIF